ncbi:MAG: hypothetical protein AAGA60_03685 [Cyanobacteria bacterium P01_E01_bin.42]
MALPDLVNPIRRKFREFSTFVQNPVRVLSQRGRLEVQKAYENFEIPKAKSKSENGRGTAIADIPPELESDAPQDGIQDTFRGDRQVFSAPDRNGKIESDRDFPYKFVSFYQPTEAGGIHKGTQIENDRPLFIFEYDCDRIDLPSEEVEEKLRELVESFSLSPLQRDKFRLIVPNKIAKREDSEEIIYAIAERPSKSWTLREYLEYVENIDRKGAISTLQVVRFLDLILQSLWFLHQNPLRLSRETTQPGLAHGNLTLDNLLWVANEEQGSVIGQNFWIYILNLHVFSDLRYSLQEKAASQSEKGQDLRRLGELGFNLWLGKTEAVESLRKENNHLFDTLGAKKSKTLYEFLQDLEGGNFSSGDIARNKLLSLRKEIEEEYRESLERDRPILSLVPLKRRKRNYWWIAIAIGSACFFLAFVAFQALRSLGIKLPNVFSISSEQIVEIPREARECYMTNIEELDSIVNLPQLGLIEQGSIWERIVTKKSLVAANNTSFEKMLQQRLGLREDLTFIQANNNADILQRLRNTRESFALTGAMNAAELEENGLQQTIVAYDALVFFIPFNNSYLVRENFAKEERQDRGREAIEKQIYLDGELIFDRLSINAQNNLSIIQENENNLSFSIDYIPPEQDARDFLVERLKPKLTVEGDILQTWMERQLIEQAADFSIAKPLGALSGNLLRSLSSSSISNVSLSSQQKENLQGINPPTSYTIFAEMFAKYNNNRQKSLGFGWLSMVMGQCTVYPLAYNGKQVVRDYYNSDRQPISPETDLCNDKGSYWGSADNIQDYELSYPLAVVYPENSTAGEKFSDILLTMEGQFLLREAGLIPRLKLPNTPAQVIITEGGKCQI